MSIDRFVASPITRRDFLKKSSQAALLSGGALTLGAAICGCAHIGLTQEGPVHYPLLLGHKIQSPEHYGLEGCMTGGWFGWSYSDARVPLGIYGSQIGKALSVLFLKYEVSRIPNTIRNGFLTSYMIPAAEMGVIPCITYDASYRSQEDGDIRKEVIDGKHDEAIMRTAQNLKQYGERYGGFFIRTMREMNLSTIWPWAGNPSKFKKVWTHVWTVFDGEGANEYATWIFNPYVAQGRGIADSYYPGDQYVDWIGINGYNWENQSWGVYESFFRLFAGSYSRIRREHPSKPIIISETGTPNTHSKPRWVGDAFESVKENFPGVKALCWWSELWSHGRVNHMDSRIDSSPEALQAFRAGISEPYFLGKVPYRG